MHKVHHSRRLPATNSNYASVLSVWDRLARSYLRPEAVGPIDFGLQEFVEPRWQSIAGMLKTPFTGTKKLAAREPHWRALTGCGIEVE
jgi:sterol desaturase/sphingolipid hydroxylase (fatty acid hydroxylase superfamily)